MTPIQYRNCQINFHYFVYYLKNHESKDKSFAFHGDLLDENNLSNFFSLERKFYSEDKKIFLVEEDEKNTLSDFFYFLMYYNAFLRSSSVIYITEPKNIRFAASNLVSMSSTLKSVTKINHTYVEMKKRIDFTNGSSIKFLSDTTYDLKSSHKIHDLILFDNACLKNFEKLNFLLESVLNNLISRKIILNFNNNSIDIKESQEFEFFKKDFKSHTKLVTL